MKTVTLYLLLLLASIASFLLFRSYGEGLTAPARVQDGKAHTVAAAALNVVPHLMLALAAVGVLMNTRGLMELIVLNVGLDLGVISPTLFTMMVIMAFVTTIATTPLLHRLVPESRKALVQTSA